MKYVLLASICVWVGCSLVIETGTPIPDDDAAHSPWQVRDAALPIDDAADSNHTSMSDSIAPSETEDIGAIESTSDMTLVAPETSPDQGVAPECSTDEDCESGDRCVDETCQTAPCMGICDDSEVCIAGCCQPPAEVSAQGACAHPIIAGLGLTIVEEQRVGHAEGASAQCLLPDEAGYTHSFFAFEPDQAGPYCVRTSSGSQDTDGRLAVIVRSNCCESPETPLECIVGTVADPAPWTTFDAIETQPTIIHLYGLYRPAMGITIEAGPCACEITEDCAQGEACINRTCIRRLGTECDEPNHDCGRLARCEDGICQSG